MSESPELSGPYKALIDYLDTKEFTYKTYPGDTKVSLRLTGKNANYRIIARISRNGDYFQVHAYYPLCVRDEKLRVSAAELITRANYNMNLGHFEMDMKDGEIRFHITHMLDDSGLSFEVIDRFMMSSYYTMDRYFPAIMQHIHAGYTPEDAVFHAELDFHAASVVEKKKKPKKKDNSKADPKTPGKTSKLSPPDSRNADAELPTTSSEAPIETPLVRKNQNQGEKPTAGGEGNQGQGELPL